MEDVLLQRLNAAYEQHPLTAVAIMDRIRSDRALGTSTLTEFDFAVDLSRGITDQNHVGELAAVIEIARYLHAEREPRVLDVGSGLGGPARVLAYLFRCHVIGVEITQQRFRDSIRLTELAGLRERAQFV